MMNKKEERPLGNEVKFKTVKKNSKYFQGLEYREIDKQAAPRLIIKKNEEELVILPIGSK